MSRITQEGGEPREEENLVRRRNPAERETREEEPAKEIWFIK